MEVHTKSVEEQGKINRQLGDEQREIKSQLTKLTNSYKTNLEEELVGIAMLKPIFVPKSERDTIAMC